MPDELRDRMVECVMRRDRLTKEAAVRVVNGLSIAELTRLELEARPRATPAFTSDYDPYAR